MMGMSTCLRRLMVAIVAGGLCVAGVNTAAFLTDGSLDPTFGVGGVVIQDFDNTDNVLDDMAIQPDGGIVGVGGGLLARFRANGSLDPAFGSAGIVRTAPKLLFRRVAVQRDGKIVAAGISRAGAATSPCVVGRYNPDGTLDASFGTSGVAFLDFPELCINAFDIAVRANGTIVTVLSLFRNSVPRRTDFATVRLDANGSLDTSFNGTGVVQESFDELRFPSALAVQLDGTTVVVGQHLSGYVLIRYNEDGSRDTSFNRMGLVVDHVEGDVGATLQQPEGIVVQDDGALGIALTGAFPRFSIVRYLPDGSRDPAFGTGGVALGPPGTSTAIALQPDGRILTAGLVVDKLGGLGLARFNHDGSEDLTFNAEGFMRIRFDPAVVEQGATPLLVQTDDRIVLGATLNTPSKFPPRDWVLVRFRGAQASGASVKP
jgi:uncharacterized delta-60 repeat protein